MVALWVSWFQTWKKEACYMESQALSRPNKRNTSEIGQSVATAGYILAMVYAGVYYFLICLTCDINRLPWLFMATQGYSWLVISASLVVIGNVIASIGKGSIKKHVHRKKNQARGAMPPA
jgi:hypothetical protein